MRRLLIVCAVFTANALVMVILGMVGTMLMFGNDGPDLDDLLSIDETWWWGFWGLPAIIVSFTQLAFVLPIIGRKPIVSSHGKPLWMTVAAATVVASALTCGLLFAVLEAFDLFESVLERIFDSDFRSVFPPAVQNWTGALWPWLFIGAGWLAWTPLVLTFARRRNETRWGRWVGLLLAGTVVETLIVIPIDVMVRRRTDCYCAAGTFYALIISMWALLWLTGPGIVIAATSKRRRSWHQNHCRMCGYEKGPRPAAQCPECGHAWAP